MAVDTAKYKAELETMLTTLEAELKTLGINNPEVPEDWQATPQGVEVAQADPNVAADRVEDWETRRATVAELETRYNNIKRALNKIEEGTYGVCEICGDEIESDRLDANPAARTNKAHINDEADLPR